MSFRAIEPRGAVALAVMSLALLSLLRRGGAFRSLPLLDGLSTVSRKLQDGCWGRHSSGANGGARCRDVGPEGTPLPDVMHRVVGADELKVGVGGGKKLARLTSLM